MSYVRESSTTTEAPNELAPSQLISLGTLSVGLVAISFAPIFIRLSETEMGAMGSILDRMVIFFVTFGCWEWIRPKSEQALELKKQPITLTQWSLLIAVGVISVLSLVLWAVSLEYTSVAKSMLLSNLTPLFTSTLGWLILGKRFGGKFLMGMAIALFGAMALGIEDLGGADGSLIGDLLALLSAVFLGSYFLVVEQLRTRFSATVILLWRCAVGSIVLLPLTFFREGKLFPVSAIAIGAVIGLGMISEGLGQRLIATCLERLSASFVAVFLLLEPIISAILAWIILHENLSPITWVGFAIVLTGIYLAQSSDAEAKNLENAVEQT